MNVKVLSTAVVAALLGASVALAAPPPGKGKPLATGAACKPKVTVVLKGSLTATSTSALGVDVKRANRHGAAWVTGGVVASVLVDEDTKVRRRGAKAVEDLLVGDRVVVQARACKADLADGATPQLTAARVVAHPVS